MADRDLRQLEREALLGDIRAQRRLDRERARTSGDPQERGIVVHYIPRNFQEFLDKNGKLPDEHISGIPSGHVRSSCGLLLYSGAGDQPLSLLLRKLDIKPTRGVGVIYTGIKYSVTCKNCLGSENSTNSLPRSRRIHFRWVGSGPYPRPLCSDSQGVLLTDRPRVVTCPSCRDMTRELSSSTKALF